MTNYHVIERARIVDLSICFPDNPGFSTRTFGAELVAEDPRNDLAVLRIDCDIPALRIDSDYRHTNGQKIVAIGSPGTGGDAVLPNLSTPGRMGPPYRAPDGSELWTFSADINPGNSGGPLVEESSGTVVGVAQGGFTRTRSQALAVPHSKLLDIIHRATSSTATRESREQTLHRSRFCVRQMDRTRQIADRILEASCEAAARVEGSAEDRFEAYNRLRSEALRRCSEELTAFETVISGEVLTL